MLYTMEAVNFGLKFVWFSMVAALFYVALGASHCHADDYNVVDLKELNFSYRQFLPGGSDPLITDNGLPNRTLGQGIDLNVNLKLAEYFYWDNKIVTMTDQDSVTGSSQFRMVGWNFRLGLNVTENVQIGYWHFSEHVLDYTAVFPYPRQDAVEIKVIIYRSGSKPNGLF
jgi:hypothetical protein